MAWYSKYQKLGYEVRGSVDIRTNSFPTERIYHYEMKGGEYLRDDSVEKPKDAHNGWVAPRIPVKKDDGGQKVSDMHIDRDVYINCKQGNKIFCFTADEYNCRKHTFEVELSTARWNRLRDFYNKNIGNESDYYYVGKDKDGKESMQYHNEVMMSKIIDDGRLYDFLEGDTELFFKCDDFDLLDFLEPRRNKVDKKTGKVKSNKHPYHRDYLDWSNNRKARVPDKELDRLKDARFKIYGEIEFGSKKALTVAQDVDRINNEFLEKHGITERVRRDNKIKDTDRIIYHLGLWDEYIKCWG